MTNIEKAASEYAREREAAYIKKRGGSVPRAAAQNVYDWAFNRFMNNPEIETA